MFNELFGSFFNAHKNHIPSSHTHIKYKKSRKKNVYHNWKKKKKTKKKSRKENEIECSMNYLDHFLMFTRTTFHPPHAHEVQGINKKEKIRCFRTKRRKKERNE